MPGRAPTSRPPATVARLGLLALAALAGGASLGSALAVAHGLTGALGSRPWVTSFLLAAALGGSALGIGGGARIADRGTRPLSSCAGILILLGALAALTPEVAGMLPGGLLGLLRLGVPVPVARALLGASVVVPLAALLGATWPFWARGLLATEGSERSVGKAAAAVLSAQMLGAALGAFLAGLRFAPALGFAGTLRLFAGVVAAVGAVLLLISRNARAAEGSSETAAPARRGLQAATLLVAGFATLGCQALGSRSLAFFFDGLHDAFVMVLAADFIALGLGAATVGLLISRMRSPRAGLVAACGLAAFATLAALLALPAIGGPASAAARSGAAWRGETFLVAAALLVLPAGASATILPLGAWAAARAGGGVGAALARSWGSLALGGAAGALVVPLVLVPALDIRAAGAAMAALFAAASLMLARGAALRIASLLALALGVAVMVWAISAPRPLILDSHVFARGRGVDRELLSSRDGRSSSVSVVRDLRRGSTALYTDTFAAVGTGRDNPGTRVLGHLPLLLHPDPARVLVAGFGTGTAARAVAAHPEVQRLRLVDVEAEVFAAAGHVSAANHDVLAGRAGLEIEVAVEDGRFDLLVSEESWDVIILEPLMPYTPRAAWLYSEDFYRLARERLNAGGIVAQWLPVHALAPDAWQTLVKSFVEVFPGGALFFFEQSAVLIGRHGGGPIAWDSMAARAHRPEVADDLARALVSGPEDLLAALVASGPTLREALAGVAPMRDDRPSVIFLETRPESLGFRPLRDTLGLLRQLARREDEEGPEDRGAASWCLLPVGCAQEVAALRSLRRDLLAVREIETALWCDARAGSPMPKGPDPVLRALRAALAEHPEHREGRRLLRRREYLIARALARAELLDGRPFEALSSLAPFAGLPEWELGGEVLQAVALLAAGDGAGAATTLDRVLGEHPREVRALVARAAAQALLGGGPPARDDRAVARAVDAERAAAEIAFIERAQRAARDRGFRPLADLRQRFERRLQAGIWDDPAEVITIPGELGLEPGDLRLLLLARHYAIEIEGEGTPGVIALRAAAVLGIQRALPHLLRRSERGLGAEGRRALAALVPRDEAALRAIFEGEDVIARRLLVACAASRGDRDLAPRLLAGLVDPDSEVRLFTDRALRRLTGLNAGYDYLAEEPRRRAAAARWRALLGR